MDAISRPRGRNAGAISSLGIVATSIARGCCTLQYVAPWSRANYYVFIPVQVYRRLERQPAQPIMNLQTVSPYLLHARDLVVAIPGASRPSLRRNPHESAGTYAAGKPLLTIQKFSTQLTVLIKSNKKPRKFRITGSDGQDYEFGLKGARRSRSVYPRLIALQATRICGRTSGSCNSLAWSTLCSPMTRIA